eukprot:SAG11_NODE_1598_length_4610_cov_2.897362_3_plen_214_part_00
MLLRTMLRLVGAHKTDPQKSRGGLLITVYRLNLAAFAATFAWVRDRLSIKGSLVIDCTMGLAEGRASLFLAARTPPDSWRRLPLLSAFCVYFPAEAAALLYIDMLTSLIRLNLLRSNPLAPPQARLYIAQIGLRASYGLRAVAPRTAMLGTLFGVLFMSMNIGMGWIFLCPPPLRPLPPLPTLPTQTRADWPIALFRLPLLPWRYLTFDAPLS